MPEESRPAAPALPEWLGFAWRCWERLHHDRPLVPRMDGAPVPQSIPWRDVAAWADRHRLPPEEMDLLDGCVRHLDAAYLDWWRMDQERQRRARLAGGPAVG